jgi:hypothetical protein
MEVSVVTSDRDALDNSRPFVQTRCQSPLMSRYEGLLLRSAVLIDSLM